MNLEATKSALFAEYCRLESERDQITAAHAGETPSEESGELSDYGNHPGDQATTTYLRERDLALVETIDRMLQKVGRALEKIANGSYGQCDRCGVVIAQPRLEAMPEASLCLACQEVEDGL